MTNLGKMGKLLTCMCLVSSEQTVELIDLGNIKQSLSRWESFLDNSVKIKKKIRTEKHLTKRHSLVDCRTRKTLFIEGLKAGPSTERLSAGGKGFQERKEGMLTNPTSWNLSLLQKLWYLELLV